MNERDYFEQFAGDTPEDTETCIAIMWPCPGCGYVAFPAPIAGGYATCKFCGKFFHFEPLHFGWARWHDDNTLLLYQTLDAIRRDYGPVGEYHVWTGKAPEQRE